LASGREKSETSFFNMNRPEDLDEPDALVEAESGESGRPVLGHVTCNLLLNAAGVGEHFETVFTGNGYERHAACIGHAHC
jgi:hypothetical protein